MPIALRLGLTAVSLVTLAGCATGNVQEAREAQTREATRGAILPDVQETRIIEDYFPTPGTPEPTRTPLPTLATLTLATQIGQNNQPVAEVDSVRQGETIYAVAEIHHLAAGQTVTAIWATLDGSEIDRTIVPVDRNLDAAWVPLRWTVSGVGPGSYAVFVYVDDRLLNSLVFDVI